MAKFGQTWWGGKWLNSLSHIDYSNRLPRGRRYAGNGSVRDITINKNKIKAKVQGTMSTPYRISITVPEFSKKEKKQLMDEVINNPLVLSKLINRELPSGLHKIAQDNGIKIFPRTWKDFQMDCSCPDWAVPCKHIAAVIYIIANEIDRNPFQVFHLHGLDIPNELAQAGYDSTGGEIGIPGTNKFLLSQKPETGDAKDKDYFSQVDYSTIPPLKEHILSLLEEETIFTSKKFKPLLKQAYTKTAKGIVNYMSAAEEVSEIDFQAGYEKYQKAEIIINNDFFYFDTILYSETDEKHFSKQDGLKKLIGFINAVPGKYAERLPPGLKALYAIFHFSVKLLHQSAFIPQILQVEGGEYFIRQIPALINEEVKAVFGLLLKITPAGLVQVTEKAYKTKYLPVNEQVILVSSLFLDHFMSKFYGSTLHADSDDGQIARLFFDYEVLAFDKLGQKGTADAIYKWLSKFYIAQQEYAPVIKVEEADDNLFAVSLLVENTRDGLQEPIPLSTFLAQKQYNQHKFPVFQALSNLSEHFEDLDTVIASSGKEELFYDSESFTTVLLKIMPKVKLLGIKIILPRALAKLARPQKSLALTKNQNQKNEKSYLSLDKMLEFQWQIAIGDANISVDEFLKLVKGYSGIVKFKDQYVLIRQEEIDKLMKGLDKKTDLNANELLQAAVSEEYESAKISISPGARKIIQDLLQTGEVPLPEGINASLRPYQLSGYEWLYKNSKVGFGSIIADDMGLGKTLQVIAALQKLKTENRLKNKGLVIVPTTLLTNWTKEIEKFAPGLNARIYHGPNRELVPNGTDLIITTYGLARSDEKVLSAKKWSAIVIDEAQNIKNPSTAQSKAVKKLKAPVKIAMSGTPVENRLSEYWSIFDFVNKKYLGSAKYFQKEFAIPIEKERDQSKQEKFRKITAPFIIRRLKTDKSIIKDLPDKVENNKFVKLTKEQTGIYQNVVNNMMAQIEGLEEQNDIKRQGLVLKLMTALKQICNHPSQFLKKDDFNPELSGKAMLLLDLLEKIYESNEKVLIFTQYKEMGLLLEQMISNILHNETLFLHGGTSRKNRDKMVDDFQQKPHLKTFILSIKAAGTGLNLTAANHVIHYDLWWNPAVENQATDRAFRIGQQKNVMVYRMITQGSFEEKINKMLTAKKELADLTVAAGEKWIGKLSDKELKELVN